MRFGRDEGVPERHLRGVLTAQPEPAVAVEPHGVRVVDGAQGAWVPRAHGLGQETVIHAVEGKASATPPSTDSPQSAIARSQHVTFLWCIIPRRARSRPPHSPPAPPRARRPPLARAHPSRTPPPAPGRRTRRGTGR